LDDLGRRPLDASAGRDSAFGCLFGRDSLRMALDLLDDFPAVARVTLRRLTALQGVGWNGRSEEEPGRIPHEHRTPDDPRLSAMSQAWEFPYYGAVDTTPLYVVLIGAYCRRHGPAILGERVRGRDGRLMTIAAGLERAVAWIERRLVQDGWVCVRRGQPLGLQHPAACWRRRSLMRRWPCRAAPTTRCASPRASTRTGIGRPAEPGSPSNCVRGS
ncbi:MAG: hypothetical protein K6U88_04830, partial [Dehalococcoidia bacterium]|nr:hypothetical protein [Dehalococcoidia bacterium]